MSKLATVVWTCWVVREAGAGAGGMLGAADWLKGTRKSERQETDCRWLSKRFGKSVSRQLVGTAS